MTFQERPQPLISVVMPVYNTARFLRRTMDSVLNQTYRNIQFIVVDDCSTDGSAEILASYDDPRLEIFRMEENSHVCAARNEGARHVRGDYVAIMDSDDVWLPDKLEKQVKVLMESPELGACFTWATIIDEDDQVYEDEESLWIYRTFRQPNRTQREWLIHLLDYGNCFCNPSALLPAYVMRTVGLSDLTLLQLQDYDYWIRLISRFPVYVLPEELFRYRRQRKDNTSISAWNEATFKRDANEWVYICTHYFDWVPDEQFAAWFRDEFRDPAASTPEELQCERAFLLRYAKRNREPMLSRLQALLHDPTTAEVLHRKYHYTPKDFYRDNSERRYVDDAMREAHARTQAELEAAQAARDGANAALDAARTEIEWLRKELAGAAAGWEGQKRETARLQAENGNLNAEREKLLAETERLSREQMQLNRDGEALRQRNEQLVAALLCTEGECSQLREKENQYKNELNAMRQSRAWRTAQFFGRAYHKLFPRSGGPD